MPIDYELYEKDGPAFACREHRRRPQVDDYWPFDDGEDMPPYDGPYELYEDGYPQIGFGRVGPRRRNAVEPTGEATGSTGRAGPSSDALEPAGGGLNDPRIEIVGQMCIRVKPEPDDECGICREPFGEVDEDNPAVSAFKCQTRRECRHLLHAQCVKWMFEIRPQQTCPICRRPPGHPTIELIHGGVRRFYIGDVDKEPVFIEHE